MPNWCSNNAEFNNEDVAEVAKLEAHLKMLDENKEARDENGLLAFFVPRPVEESENWYNWNVANWGTKWESEDAYLLFERDIEGKEELKEIAYRFDTAWGPAIDWQKKVTKDYPGIIFHLWYEETGMGFCGTLTNFAGETVEEVESVLLRIDTEPMRVDVPWTLNPAPTLVLPEMLRPVPPIMSPLTPRPPTTLNAPEVEDVAFVFESIDTDPIKVDVP